MPAALAAQSAHSHLRDPALLSRFDGLSHKLMCTCGCNMPLRNCNHTGHCNAWPARHALDKLLESGMSDEAILAGFKNGFGGITETNAAFEMAKTPDYSYMLVQFKDGFGSQIMSMPESNYLGVFSFLAALLILGIVALFIRSRRKVSSRQPLQLLDENRRAQILHKISTEQK